MIALTAKDVLPQDGTIGHAGRAGRAAGSRRACGGPRCAATACSMSAPAFRPSARCANRNNPAAALQAARGTLIGDLEGILANTPPDRRDRTHKPWLLAPNDLQVLKAAGVTFPISMLERVIEERARGNRLPRSEPRSGAARRRRSREAQAGVGGG